MSKRLLDFLHFEEIETSRRLQAILATLSFYCFFVLRSWTDQPGLAAESVETLNFMPMWPVEHLPVPLLLPAQFHSVLLSILSLVALAVCFCCFVRKYLRFAFLAFVVVISFELLFYLHDLRLVANFFHVHLYLSYFFIFSKQKLLFFRVGLWLVYWLAALVKLTPSWLWGEYFNSVPAKLPLFPAIPSVVTAAGLTLMIVEFFSPLLWLSKSKTIRNFSVATLLLFHIYSGVIVGHWYPTIMIPVAILGLYPMDTSLFQDYQSSPRHKVMFVSFLVFLLGGIFNFLLPGDVRTTGEGRYHGLFMFDANRRAAINITIEVGGDKHRFYVLYDWPRREVLDWKTTVQYSKNSAPFEELYQPVRVNGKVLFNPDYFWRNSSRMFSDPYVLYYYLKRLNRRFRVERLQLTLDHQLDGHAFVFRVMDVNQDQISSMSYNPFWRNSWIRVPGPDTPDAYQWP